VGVVVCVVGKTVSVDVGVGDGGASGDDVVVWVGGNDEGDGTASCNGT